MRRIATLILAATLALAMAACAPALASSDVPEEGSAAASGQAASKAQASAQEGIDLNRDNPLADCSVDAVTLKLTGVGEVELAELDAEAILGIVQNDGRVWQDRSEWDMFEEPYTLTSDNPPRFTLAFDSGLELVVRAYRALGASTNILEIACPGLDLEEQYDLTEAEYDTFAETYANVAFIAIDQAPVTVRPFEGLTADELDEVTRMPTMYDYSGNPQYLTDEQIESLVAALNKLEIQPATVDLEPAGLAGGRYDNFELVFKDGERIRVGQYTSPFRLGDDGQMSEGSYAQVYIDGALYECDQESAEDIYWDYQEWGPRFTTQYLNTRNVAEFPFENLTLAEIECINIGFPDSSNGIQRQGSIELAQRALDVLRRLRVSDDNAVYVGTPASSMNYEEYMEKTRNGLLMVCLTNDEVIDLNTDDGSLGFGLYKYEQDPELAAEIIQLHADAVASYEALMASVGNTQTLSFVEEDVITLPAQDFSGRYITYNQKVTFELPAALNAHEDGYYEDGYTFETAPVAVAVAAYDNDGAPVSGEGATYAMRDDSPASRLENEMAKAKGVGFSDYDVGNCRVIAKWGRGTGETEIAAIFDSNVNVEVYIVGRGESELSPESVLMLVTSTMQDVFVAQD